LDNAFDISVALSIDILYVEAQVYI
jgi:hypothetical protein